MKRLPHTKNSFFFVRLEMKRIIIAGLFFSLISSIGCSKSNRISPVTGTINGKPAVSLYGASNKPTDYVLIDTAAADRKLSYDGIVFAYIYNSSSNIYIMNSTTPAAEGTLTLNASNIVLTINATYTLTFGSTTYTSK